MSRATYGNGAVYKRGDVWWIQYSHRGHRVRESSGTRIRTAAVQLLRQRLGDAGQGRAPIAGRRVMFDDMVALLERDYRLKGRKSLTRAREAIARLRVTFGDRMAEVITEADFPRYQDLRQAHGAKPATVQYELRILRRMFNLAYRQRMLRDVPIFDLPKIKNARRGFFTGEQLNGLLPHLPEPLRPVMQFAFYTGWRIPSEVLTLRWDQVDLAAGEVRLWSGDSKTEEPRVFPFAQAATLDALLHRQHELAEALEQSRGVPVPWVFHRNGRRIKDCRGAWEIACERAGLEGRLMHDLRRSAVRNLVNAGVPEKTAMMLTGHKTREVFDRYNIVSPTETAGAVAKLAASLAASECHKTDTKTALATPAPKSAELPKSR